MEHVRVGEDRVCGPADVSALVHGGVAVVDRRSEAGEAEPREPASLVLGERLRGVEEERPRGRLARDRVEHRQRERECLPGGRRGRDDDALAAFGGLPGLRLVGVERVDPGRREHCGDVRMKPGRQLLGPSPTSSHQAAVGDLGSVEEGVPGGGIAQDAVPASARSAASS